MTKSRISRRIAMQWGAGAALSLSPALKLLAADPQRKFKIGACDWSMGGRYDPQMLDKAKQIGLDGVQISFGEPGIENDLRKPSVRQVYLDKCKTLGVEIASLGLGELNSRPYASDPDAERWVEESIDVMQQLKQNIALLAFFSKGDLRDKPQAQQEVIRRLKRVASKAEKAGVVFGIESWLNADDHIRIVDAIDSPAVKVYYDVANSTLRGYDIYKEIRQLGRERICQIHVKENDCLLGKGKIDFHKVKAALDDIQWNGWLIIERAMEPNKTMEACYTLNQEFLRSIFPT